MQLTTQQLGSIMLFVVMFGSLFVAITYNPNAPQNPAQPPPVPQQATTISYTAAGVEAKVLQLFPNAVLLGHTNEFDAASVESKLQKAPGLVNVSGQFVQTQDNKVNFRAGMRFSSTDKMVEAEEFIRDSNAFSAFELFPNALISIPGKIEFSNNDLGLTQEYSLPNSQAQAVVTLDTKQQDQITVTLEAKFQGQKPIEMQAFIEKNLTSSPQFMVVTDKFRLSQFENSYFMRSTAPLPGRGKLDGTKAFFDSNDYVSGLVVQPAGNETKLYFAEPEKVFAADLNTFLVTYAGIDSYSFHLDQNYLSVVVSSQQDYTSFLSLLEAELSKLGFNVRNIVHPTVSLQGPIEPTKENKGQFMKKVEEAGKKNSVELEVLQKAIIDANSIFVADQNYSFSLPTGAFEAYVKPTRVEGEEVNLTIIMSASKREGVLQIQAQEEEAAPAPGQ